MGVSLLAASALILESSLTRLLAVAQFYHFAFLAISLALLGFGASGTILGFVPLISNQETEQRKGANVSGMLVLAGIGFSLSTGLAYLIINFLPFDSYSIAWERRQILLFFLYYLVLTCPFLFAGLGIGAAISANLKESNLVYAANLFGSAFGVILTPIFMWLAGVPGTILITVILGMLVILASGGASTKKIQIGLILCVLILMISFLALSILNYSNKSPLGLRLSPYKGLSYALQIPGAKKIYGRWNALSRIDVLSGSATRVLPGLSYIYSGELPEQLGMSIDGESLIPVPLVPADQFAAGEYLPEAIAFRLRPGADTLVLDPHGGMSVLQALAGGAQRVFAVVSNPNEIKAVDHSIPGKDIFQESAIQVFNEAPRVYLNSQSGEYTLIVIPLTDPYRPVGSGAYSLTETYHYTVESYQKMLLKLTNNGILVVTRWLQTPPSEEIKLIATLLEALERTGVSDPGVSLIAFRGIQTITVLVQPQGWRSDELRIVRDFLDDRKYDLVWAPDVSVGEVNRYNKLQEPYYYLEVNKLISSTDRSKYYSQYPYDVRPANDDHPFFYNYFKWSQTHQILSMLGHTWQPFGGSGYLVLIALLALVTILSIFLIGVPLAWIRYSLLRRWKPDVALPDHAKGVSSWRVIIYFGGIGLGYLLVEIPLIQRAILWFGNPVSAFSIIVAGLLVFSGLGSYYLQTIRLPLWIIVTVLSGMVIFVTLITNLLNDFLLRVPITIRTIAVLTVLAPLGFVMGQPFPLGIKTLVSSKTEIAVIAWAVNGCASVLSAIVAAILALELGFTLVLFLGACSYSLVIPVLINYQKQAPLSVHQ